MKVGIDGVLLGAIADVLNCKRALDIGTGTGLIALMLAQKNIDLQIDAIEIEETAYKTAKQNIQNSPFNSQIKLFHSSVQEFVKHTESRYDIIVCNPPFFIEDVKPRDLNRQMARHAEILPIHTLMEVCSKLLGDEASLWTIYPSNKMKYYQSAVVEKHLHIKTITEIKHSINKAPKRFIAQVCKEINPVKTESLVLYNDSSYTEAFKSLTKDFYLNL